MMMMINSRLAVFLLVYFMNKILYLFFARIESLTDSSRRYKKRDYQERYNKKLRSFECTLNHLFHWALEKKTKQ